MVQSFIEPFIKLASIRIYMQINTNTLIIRNSLMKAFIDHILTFQKDDAQWNN
jgi:hypothetical protein